MYNAVFVMMSTFFIWSPLQIFYLKWVPLYVRGMKAIIDALIYVYYYPNKFKLNRKIFPHENPF